MDLLARLYDYFQKLQERLQKEAREHLLLTGGAAAFLYASDRPFSNDLDFMLPEKFKKEAEMSGFKFKANLKKPIFHSFFASFKMESLDCSIILKTVVQPQGSDHFFEFTLNPEIEARQFRIPYQNDFIRVVPPEFLTLIKLLASRGEELGKYDLYDAQAIMEKASSFDWDFFKKLILDFCQPLQISIPILLQHAETLEIKPLHLALKSFEQLQ